MDSNLELMYGVKDTLYFSNVRKDIIDLIEGSNLRILEIGCGSGATLIELKRIGKAKEIVGIEINESSVMDSKKYLDNVIIGNIENLELDYPENYFDIIILGDVLEHLINPWAVLSKIKKNISSKGLVISSIPNIRQFRTMVSIFIKGDFKYTDAGILDRTHLRFFCKKNIIELFNADYDILSIRNNPIIQGGKKALFNKLTLGKFEEFFPVQYIVVAKKK